MTSRPDADPDVLDEAEAEAVAEVVMETTDADAVADDVLETSVPGDDPPVPDERLLEAHDLARAALTEITPAESIGDPVGYALEDEGVVSLRFDNRLAGYPGWFWTVSVARVDDAEPTVLEVELLPGDDALLAPDWTPWAVRLADYHAQQQALAAASALAAESALDLGIDDDLDEDDLDDDDLDDEDLDDDEGLDDVVDLDAADFDRDGSPILHAGDVDGVDIDELDENDDDEDEFDDEEDDDMSDQGLPGVNAAPAGIDIPGGDALLSGRVPDENLPTDDLVSDEDDLGDEEMQDPDGASR